MQSFFNLIYTVFILLQDPDFQAEGQTDRQTERFPITTVILPNFVISSMCNAHLAIKTIKYTDCWKGYSI